MCGKSVWASKSTVVTELDVKSEFDLGKVKTLASGSEWRTGARGMWVPTVLLDTSNQRTLTSFHWGHAVRKGGNEVANAKAETLTSTEAWQNWFGHRCVLGMRRFAEREAETRNEFWFADAENETIYAAGVWRKIPLVSDGKVVAKERKLLVLTIPANESMHEVSSAISRAPLTLPISSVGAWLDRSITKDTEVQAMVDQFTIDHGQRTYVQAAA